MIHQADIGKSYPVEPHTNIRFLNWHQSYHMTCFFQSRKQNWKNICPCMSSELFVRADLDLPHFSFDTAEFQCDGTSWD